MQENVLSIITVVYNDVQIEKTIQSIIPFLNKEIEYIIIDGGSTDKTLDVINNYKQYIDIFISEPDKGIYDAMNKAVKLSSGRFILHLNSGDSLINLSLNDLKTVPENVYAITYPCLINNNTIYKSSYNWKLKFMNTMHHQSTFYRKEIVNYDLRYKIFSDFDLNLRLYNSDFTVAVKHSPCISNHITNGISSKNVKEYKIERIKLILKRSGLLILLFSYVYRLFNKLLKF